MKKENEILEALEREYLQKKQNIEKKYLKKKKKDNKIIIALKNGDKILKIMKDLKVSYEYIKKIIDKHPDLFKDRVIIGRPKVEAKRVRYSFRTPKTMADKIDAKIKTDDITETKFFNNLLEEWGCGDE